MSESPISLPDDAPLISEDFLQGDVHAGLERMRKRLLDLTSRNRLLNFPQRTSKSVLRTVDELPDELFSHLVGGKDLVFKPIPRPRGLRVPAQRALDFEPPEDGAEAPNPARYPSAKEHAESLGLATSYDLPEPGTEQQGDRYTDREIQTLHFPDDLDVILRKISSAARLAIEETGSNMLYLIFGFLEWYETEDSEQPRFAPLLLLPVGLEKGSPDAAGSIRYLLKYSGEDISANVSLSERLKRDFAIEMPDLGDDDTPEAYFSKFAFLTSRFPRWRVRRQVTLSLLSFGKILMYRDLEPDTWPVGGSPADHDRVNEFFRGIQRDAITFAEDYAIDDESTRAPAPMLVDEADSSQHSALIDALAGKNLVIEGPPGTGKSQTITNLIASALAAGKSVLFVSEKLAALEVVRHRLDKVGLGLFCLELHSHKAQKRQILDDVEQRMHAHGSFRDPAELDSKLASLDSDKKLLASYVAAINQPFGALGRTLHDIIWSARRRRASLPFSPQLLEGLSVPNASSVDPRAFADLQQRASQFSIHLQNVQGHTGVVGAHPWFGVRNSRLTFADAGEVEELLAAWLRTCEEVRSSVRRANAVAGTTLLGESIAGVRKFADEVRRLPHDCGVIAPDLLPALGRADFRARVSEFINWINRYRLSIDAISSMVGKVPIFSLGEIVEVSTLSERCRSSIPTAIRLGDISAAAAQCNVAVTKIDQSAEALDRVNRTLRVQVPLTNEGVVLAVAALTAVRLCPVEALPFRHDRLEEPGAALQLERIRRAAEELRAQREVLGHRFDFSFMPKQSELRSHLAAMANPRPWSILRSSFRAARRTYNILSRDGGGKSAIEMRDGFRRLHDFDQAEKQFCGDPSSRNLAGEHFKGIETRYDLLGRACEWRVEIRKALVPFGQLGLALGEVIWRAQPEELHALLEETASGSLAETLDMGLAELVRTCGLGTHPASPQQLSWMEWRSHFVGVGADLHSISDRAREFGLPSTLSLDQLPELARLLAEVQSLSQLITSAPEIREVLGSHYQGTSTDLSSVAHTMALFDSLSEAPVSDEIKTWLLDKDVASRLAHLHHSSVDLVSRLPVLEARWHAFLGLAKVDEGQWLGTNSLDDSSLSELGDRARRALDHRDLLAAWFDYLRARETMFEHGFDALVLLAEGGKIGADAVGAGVTSAFLNSLIQEAFLTTPQLARFSGLSHDQVRKRFATLDRECIKLYRQRAARLIDARTIPAGVGYGSVRTYTERSLLDHEVSKQRAHIPLRQLMRRAGRAMQALKPCFMMGPLSVAQYLTPGALTFDIVVMDEASQLRPEDALGAISRARQVVIVGDRMQLPPTSFFSRIGDEIVEPDEEAGAVTEAESILDIASATYKPSRLLRWHYRSRHGSLIAFSNKEFYRGRLVVFPSPIPVSPVLGVKLIHVRDGVYERSKNEIEARRLVDTAIQFMERHPSESLGVVAMNSQQRELIEDLIENAVRRSEPAQRYISERAGSLEPFFVKNLENVQGDERDVIYISNTYGRSASGQVFQRFGPINGPTGHRRLNVLFTRARNRVVLFSSMLAEDILNQPSSSWGVRAFKGYLHYAETGLLETASFSGREPDSDFEIEVADALRERGYDVVAQVGVAGFFLDLAIRHPQKGDAFILGIECDGMTYHSGLSARDRDRLRQQVLEGLGWNIHRIWSTDWFKQPRIEVDRVVARVAELVQAEAASAAAFPQGSAADFELAYPSSERTNGMVSSDRSWAGEVSVQRLSVEEARDALFALAKDARREFPSVPDEECSLREAMIAELLKHKPTTKDAWIRNIPFDLRLATNGDELRSLLQRILAITGRML